MNRLLCLQTSDSSSREDKLCNPDGRVDDYDVAIAFHCDQVGVMMRTIVGRRKITEDSDMDTSVVTRSANDRRSVVRFAHE